MKSSPLATNSLASLFGQLWGNGALGGAMESAATESPTRLVQLLRQGAGPPLTAFAAHVDGATTLTLSTMHDIIEVCVPTVSVAGYSCSS